MPEKYKYTLIAFYKGHIRYKIKGGKYKYPFGDDLILSRNKIFNIFVIESNHKKGSISLPNLYSEIIEYLCKYLAIFYIPSKKNRQTIQKFSSYLNKLTQKEIGENIKFNKYIIYRWVFQFYWQRAIFKVIIKIIKPFGILLVHSPGYPGIIAAAKEQNVKVYELQHGLISKYHPTFAYPEWMKDKKSCLLIPDKILLWGKYWVQQQQELKFWDKLELIPIGNFRIDMNKKRKIHNIKNTKSTKILFTSQPTIQNYAIQFFNQFLNMCELEHLDIVLIIKLHPSEKNSAYKNLLNMHAKYCKVISNNDDIDLYQLFNMCSLNLSYYSTSIIEAIGLGLNTYLINNSEIKYFEDFIEMGLVHIIYTPDELLKILKDKYQVSDNNSMLLSNYIFEPMSVNNCVNYINSEIEKGITSGKKENISYNWNKTTIH